MNFETVSAKDLDRFIDDERFLLIDIRSSSEYQTMHLKGAINIPLDMIHKCCVVQKGKILILYCERGALSLIAAKELAGEGYQVKTVIGGLHAYRGKNIEYKD